MKTGSKRGEFALIEAFVDAFRRRFDSAQRQPRPSTPLRANGGPGDDCAILAGTKDDLCVTVDALVEDVHFTRKTFSFEDIGHKALAVNLSDLAAMGARPSWFLCSIAAPKSLEAGALVRIARGMAKLAAEMGIMLAGGNMSRASELSLHITAAGLVPKGKALLRGGAKAGDLIYVSGTLGDAAFGLHGGPPARQRRPQPRVALGLLARGVARAAIDISDGFAQDLKHVCRASKVGAWVDLAALPLSRAVRAAKDRGLQWAVSGGEDYELLLAIPPDRAKAFERMCAKAGEKVTPVGTFVRGAGVELTSPAGRPFREHAGHDHFI